MSSANKETPTTKSHDSFANANAERNQPPSAATKSDIQTKSATADVVVNVDKNEISKSNDSVKVSENESLKSNKNDNATSALIGKPDQTQTQPDTSTQEANPTDPDQSADGNSQQKRRRIMRMRRLQRLRQIKQQEQKKQQQQQQQHQQQQETPNEAPGNNSPPSPGPNNKLTTGVIPQTRAVSSTVTRVTSSMAQSSAPVTKQALSTSPTTPTPPSQPDENGGSSQGANKQLTPEQLKRRRQRIMKIRQLRKQRMQNKSNAK